VKLLAAHGANLAVKKQDLSAMDMALAANNRGPPRLPGVAQCGLKIAAMGGMDSNGIVAYMFEKSDFWRGKAQEVICPVYMDTLRQKAKLKVASMKIMKKYGGDPGNCECKNTYASSWKQATDMSGRKLDQHCEALLQRRRRYTKLISPSNSNPTSGRPTRNCRQHE
jgi:hypothetical protein